MRSVGLGGLPPAVPGELKPGRGPESGGEIIYGRRLSQRQHFLRLTYSRFNSFLPHLSPRGEHYLGRY